MRQPTPAQAQCSRPERKILKGVGMKSLADLHQTAIHRASSSAGWTVTGSIVCRPPSMPFKVSVGPTGSVG